jgi:hypothetical protein
VLHYFQKVARAAARRRGEEVEGSDDSAEEVALVVDLDIKGFYTLDASLEACAHVPIPSFGRGNGTGEERGKGAGGGVSRSGGGVQGVSKSALVAHIASASRTLLLGDRFFPDAFVPSSMLQFALLLQAPQVGISQDPPGTPRMCGNQTVDVEMRGASVWPMEKVRQLAKTRCGTLLTCFSCALLLQQNKY